MSELKKASVFESTNLKGIHAEIKKVYLADSRPWIIGFSGGKDSTAALQLVWHALSELPLQDRIKPVYVISSDTLVETPVIVDRIDKTLEMINQKAKEQNMPFHSKKLKPITTETFWVNLIGRGYPAPQQTFRWCTHRLKINPANRFILEKASKHGEVILVLGVRKSESMTRAQVMNLFRIKGSLLSRHSELSGAYVYTPVRDFNLDDVWGYLLQVPNPWGSSNRDLLALYRSANAGECPLVVDKTTPSCGNSRFGCWVCTVVSQDKSITALIDSGQEWMEPLLALRNFLASTQDPAKKLEIREYKRRTGKVDRHRKTGGIIPGPYKFDFCCKLLRRLLEIQIEVRQNGPNKDLPLINAEELYEIRRIWRTERGDWEDTVPKIYREVTGEDLPWIHDDIGCFNALEAKILRELCEERKVPYMLLVKLITAELAAQGMRRRSSIYPRINKILHEEWRSKEEIMKVFAKQG